MSTKLLTTEGTWKATRSDPAEGYDVWWITSDVVPHNGERDICSVPGGAKTSEGNARLIAAAKDLLAAAKAEEAAGRAQANYEYLCAGLSEGSDDATVDDAGLFALEQRRAAKELRIAAIAKAEGREHMNLGVHRTSRSSRCQCLGGTGECTNGCGY